jgi:hypothetical protein
MDEIKGIKPFSGSVTINIRYDLYDDVEKTLTFQGVSISDFVLRAFVDIANAANSFNVAHRTIEIKTHGRSLRLNASTYPALESNEICLCVTASRDTHRTEQAQASGVEKEPSDEFSGEPFNTTKH